MDISDKSVMALWAKKEEHAGRLFWLPLTVHLTDTMNVCRWLFEIWISNSQRTFCLESMQPSDEEKASDLAAFLGAVHDIGKATPAFQVQKGYSNSPDLDAALLEKLERAGFSGISGLSLAEPKKTHHTIAGEYLLKREFQVRDDIGSIIGGHHGKPIDRETDLYDQAAYTANYYQSENSGTEIYRKWKQTQRELFEWAFQASGFRSVDELPEISFPAQVIFSGFLIMADWIASNSDYFPLINLDEDEIPDSDQRYREGVRRWKRSDSFQITTSLMNGSKSFKDRFKDRFNDRFGFDPNDFQNTVVLTVGHIDKPGIMILEAPMGRGKTEAALAAAEEVAAKTGSSGLFFGLPTQATSNGMFGRIHQWLDAITKAYCVKQSLRLCHGKAALNEEMNRLKTLSAQDINIDDEDNGSVFVNEWFSGRKTTSLDDFVVGTVDGFLLTAMKQKHLALRHLGFSKKVIIIDEVHAYDAYMQQYLKEAIQWMGAYGTPVILLSATLPQDRRKEFITAYLRGLGMKKREMVFPETIEGNYYPILSYTDGRKINVQTEFPLIKDKAFNKTIVVKKLDKDNLLETVSSLLDGGGVIGIIVNTVKRAQELGMECKKQFGETAVEVLHSAFIATDRIHKEADLMRMIGKGGIRPDKKIIIGTQVIEQSLDIDFDVLITELCPMDLLLQRIGRLHRHIIVRPEKHRTPVVYVMGTNSQFEFDKGSEWVYGKYLLIRTQYYLPDIIHIPSDIPILVNQVYGREEPDFQGEQEKIYQSSLETMRAQIKNKADKAETYLIKDPCRKIKPETYNLIQWLQNPDESKSEERAAAQVRDIKETVEVVAVKKTGSGYGTFDCEEDISGRIDEPEIAKKLASQTIRLPAFITQKYGISELIDCLEHNNRLYLSKWEKQPWLKGTLGIIFDEKGRYQLGDILLKYDSEYGLREEKQDGKI